MSATFLHAASVRSQDQLLPSLPSAYCTIAAALHPIVRELLVHNANPDFADADKLLDSLHERGTEVDWARLSGPGVLMVPDALDKAQCAVLRSAVDAATMEFTDTVDGQLEYQLSLQLAQLEELIGADSVGRLASLAGQVNSFGIVARAAW